MSGVWLSQNQRELIKFMKPYVLHTAKKKKSRKTTRLDSESSLIGRLHPAEEALLDFRPNGNEIDARLYSGIVI